MIGQIQQGGRHADQGEDRHDANGDLHRPAAFVDEYHRGASDQRDDDRRNDQMIDPIDHEFRPVPSTWSVPVNPREARRTTRNSAVVAKPITMAVWTRACGSGSAYCAGSTTCPDARLGD